jgi:hypothetical protein
MFYRWNGYKHIPAVFIMRQCSLRSYIKNNIILYRISIVKDKLPFDSFVYVYLCIYEKNHIHVEIIVELS